MGAIGIMRAYVFIIAALVGIAFVSTAQADCLDFAAQRGFLPIRADGLQGRLMLIDAPRKDDIALYVTMDSKWCFVPIKVASKMCERVELLSEAWTVAQSAHRTLTVLQSLGYVCQEVQGTADH